MEARPDRALFEAAFAHDGVLVRIDLLVPESGAYRMAEVTASTRIKDYHLTDCAVQTWVCKQSELPLRRVELAHVDTAFVYLCAWPGISRAGCEPPCPATEP